MSRSSDKPTQGQPPSRYSGPEWQKRLEAGRELAERTVREQEREARTCVGCKRTFDPAITLKVIRGRPYCPECEDWSKGPGGAA